MNRAWRITRSALRSIKSHPLRSLLTSLGIVAGVAAIVMVASIAEGTRKTVELSIEGLGANRIDVNSGSKIGHVNALLPFGGLYQLSEKDVKLVKSTSGVYVASGILRGSAEVSIGQSRTTVGWIGSDQDALAVLGYDVEAGRSFTAAEGIGVRRVVHLGASTAAKLFQGRSAVGSRVRINGTSFTVIGTLARRGISMAGQDLDDVIILPINSARRQLMGDFPLPNKAVQQIGVRVHRVESIVSVQDRIRSRLNESRRPSGKNIEDFNISTVLGTLESRSRADRSMTYLLLSVATICLIVGGVGVMNIMLVSIAERTGEIGLRMAVGASPGDILAQFLLEATLLSTAGGVIGVFAGVGGALLSAKYREVSSEINIWVVLIGFFVTVASGMVFGILPARRAARLPPSHSLRQL